MKNFQSNRGVTLTEIIVVTAIFGAIAVAVFNFGGSIFSFNRTAQSNLAAQSSMRRVLKTMITEMRTASPSSLGAYPIASVATSSITFFSNIDSDDYKERVRYFLQGNNLNRGVVKPSGNPLVYNTGSESVTVMMTNIVNGATPIFEYFDENYGGTSTPLTYPVQIGAIRLIKVKVTIDADPNKQPGPINAESQVTLRNLKDNL